MSETRDSYEVHWLLAEDGAQPRLEPLARGAGRRLEWTPVRERLRIYDTFDRRLERNGCELRIHSAGRAARNWQLVETDGGERAVQSSRLPGLVATLPPGPLGERLAPLIGVRRLLPRLDLRIEGDSFALVDREGKATVRGGLEILTARGGDTRRILRLERLRGFDEEWRRTVAILGRQLEAPFVAGGRLAAMLPTMAPPNPPQIEPETPTALAARQTLAALRETFVVNLDGARRNLDPEFLHDLRVATRRARAVLGELRRELREPAAESLRAHLRRIAGGTNRARDLDVHLLELGELATSVPPEQLEGLRAVHAHLGKLRARESRAVAKLLRPSAVTPLLEEWRDWIASEPPGDTRSIGVVAKERLAKRAGRLAEDAADSEIDSHPEQLHQLRLLGKKVRYLLEAFGALALEDPGAAVKALKLLQDRLGELNDLAVQRERLRELAEQLVGQLVRDRDPRPLLALGAWGERLRIRESERRRELLDRREEWLDAVASIAAACGRD